VAFLAASQMAAAAAGSATEANFELGLVGQYVDSDQNLGEQTTTYSTLSAGVRLRVNGFVIDPRFLSYSGSVAGLVADVNDSRDISYKRKTTSYSGALDLFSSRMLSIGGIITHGSSETVGTAPSSAVGGIYDHRSAYARLRSRRVGFLQLSRLESAFSATGSMSVRDRDRTVDRLEYRAPVAAKGRTLSFNLWRERSALGQLSAYQADRGLLRFGINPTSRSQWRSRLSFNQQQLGFLDDGVGPPSRSVLFNNNYTRTYQNGSRVGASADLQQTESIDTATRSAVVGGLFSRPLGTNLDFNTSGSVLFTMDDARNSLDQYSVSVGVGWSGKAGQWFLGVAPALSFSTSFVRIESDSNDTEPLKRLGAIVSASAQRELWKGNFSASAFYSDNQASLTPAASDVPGGVTNFLGGIETARQNLRLAYDRDLSDELSANLRFDATHRTRVDIGRRAEDSSASLVFSMNWRAFGLGLGYSQGDSDTSILSEDSPLTDFSFETSSMSASLTWTPLHWLNASATVSNLRRSVQGIFGSYTNSHAVVSAHYARLTFFARASWNQVDGTDIIPRTDRRVAVGVERSFNFGLW
jgi:hypothetical protein